MTGSTSFSSLTIGSIPVGSMFYDLWDSMRAKDAELADQVIEPTFVFMRAQTDKIRTKITEIGQYLQYRERDVGKLEMNCTEQISIVNGIYSWGKELKQSYLSSEEGSFLCSGVKVLADSTELDIEAAKTSQGCLWAMLWEWERKHKMLCTQPLGG
ncbi:Aristolochene synthase [Cytospora mali]|uniref:Aristolochene synthase n=1 Tax=Cytospora mali TaxID=578113 RepID=A0A194VRI3_CYTMA|nr:Aristolochene synthase [Valsa mali]